MEKLAVERLDQSTSSALAKAAAHGLGARVLLAWEEESSGAQRTCRRALLLLLQEWRHGSKDEVF